MIQAAGVHEPGEGAKEPEAPFPLGVVQPGGAEPGGGLPADRRAPVADRPDVHAPIDHHVEVESRPGPELEHPHAPLGSVPEGHEAHPRDRVEPAHPAGELAA